MSEKDESAEQMKKDIKSILMGNLVKTENGRYTAGQSRFITPYGIADNAQLVLFFGVTERRYFYKTSLRNNTQALFQAEKAMSKIGRLVELESAPDSAVCYLKSIIFRPVVLVFEECREKDDTKQLCLRAFCGRSLFAFLPLMRAAARVEKVMPKQIARQKKK